MRGHRPGARWPGRQALVGLYRRLGPIPGTMFDMDVRSAAPARGGLTVTRSGLCGPRALTVTCQPRGTGGSGAALSACPLPSLPLGAHWKQRLLQLRGRQHPW